MMMMKMMKELSFVTKFLGKKFLQAANNSRMKKNNNNQLQLVLKILIILKIYTECYFFQEFC